LVERTLRSVDSSRFVEQFRALGDPVRWAIVRELQGGTRCACELAEVASVSAPLLSHHLKVLREAGLITGAKRGRWIDYTLDGSAIVDLVSGIDTSAGAAMTASPTVEHRGRLA
jgi:ArsR family transcriptional regulator